MTLNIKTSKLSKCNSYAEEFITLYLCMRYEPKPMMKIVERSPEMYLQIELLQWWFIVDRVRLYIHYLWVRGRLLRKRGVLGHTHLQPKRFAEKTGSFREGYSPGNSRSIPRGDQSWSLIEKSLICVIRLGLPKVSESSAYDHILIVGEYLL